MFELVSPWMESDSAISNAREVKLVNGVRCGLRAFRAESKKSHSIAIAVAR